MPIVSGPMMHQHGRIYCTMLLKRSDLNRTLGDVQRGLRSDDGLVITWPRAARQIRAHCNLTCIVVTTKATRTQHSSPLSGRAKTNMLVLVGS